MEAAIDATSVYPTAVLIIDYVLTMIMWTLIGRGVLDFFIARDRDMVIAKVFRDVTNPVIRFFRPLTPTFLVPLLIPFYVAWWFFFLRYYVIPFFFFGKMGLLSFSLEGTIVAFVRNLL